MSSEYALIHSFITQGLFQIVVLVGGIALFGLLTRIMHGILHEDKI